MKDIVNVILQVDKLHELPNHAVFEIGENLSVRESHYGIPRTYLIGPQYLINISPGSELEEHPLNADVIEDIHARMRTQTSSALEKTLGIHLARTRAKTFATRIPEIKKRTDDKISLLGVNSNDLVDRLGFAYRRSHAQLASITEHDYFIAQTEKKQRRRLQEYLNA